MNENIDLTKILEGCEGIELYTSIFGYVKVDKIYDEDISIITDSNTAYLYPKNGIIYNHKNAECTIFPSKEQRDWSKFVRPIKKEDIVVCQYTKSNGWFIGKYLNIIERRHYVSDLYNNKYPFSPTYIIPLKKFNPNNIEESLKYNIQTI